jgi:peptide-methionine (R)-S-oxide reductase
LDRSGELVFAYNDRKGTENPMHRRKALTALAAALLGGAGILPANAYEVTKSDAEWKKLLSPEAYVVLRQQGTEIAGSSPLDHEFRKGMYACAGCALDLYSSATKYDSGTGWPSFWKPLPNAVLTSPFSSLNMGSEVHCRRCGGHLGHVFDDGPRPTGQRYCMDGVALTFRAV